MKNLLFLASLLLAVSCDSGDNNKKKSDNSLQEDQDEMVSSEESEDISLGAYQKPQKGMKCDVVGLSEHKEIFLFFKPSLKPEETEIEMYNLGRQNRIGLGMVEFDNSQTFGFYTLKKMDDGTLQSGTSLLSHKVKPLEDVKSTSYTAILNFESDFSSGVIYSRRLSISDKHEIAEEKLEIARFESCEETTAFSVIDL